MDEHEPVGSHERSGRYRCLGVSGRDTGLPAGTCLIELIVNGQGMRNVTWT
jgi:hypothetical protein